MLTSQYTRRARDWSVRHEHDLIPLQNGGEKHLLPVPDSLGHCRRNGLRIPALHRNLGTNGKTRLAHALELSYVLQCPDHQNPAVLFPGLGIADDFIFTVLPPFCAFEKRNNNANKPHAGGRCFEGLKGDNQ